MYDLFLYSVGSTFLFISVSFFPHYENNFLITVIPVTQFIIIYNPKIVKNPVTKAGGHTCLCFNTYIHQKKEGERKKSRLQESTGQHSHHSLGQLAWSSSP